ncbi:MAG: hypothetical protein JWO47_110 [Candidatus Saccharibacteria bacterium]|nr:hypothetical protein [Candidatus Saccharibacteria bacterium]
MSELYVLFSKSWRFIKKRLHKVWRSYSHLFRRAPRALRTVAFRATVLSLAFLIVFTTFGAFVMDRLQQHRYVLSKQETSLVGKSTVDTKLIKTTDTAFTYNRAEEASPDDVQKVLSIAAKQDATGKEPYSASLAKDPSKGITFGDSEGKRTFTLIPEFGVTEPKEVDGRVIYPSGSDHHVYTFKKNGIKSDITMPERPRENTKDYQWQLNADTDLEARMLSDGGIGIYSSDPALFGNLQVGDEKSQALIDKARKNGAKDTLVYELPKPFMLNDKGIKNYDDVSYTFTDNILTLHVRNLKNQTYPLTIDPTIVVTTTSDFTLGTGDTGNIDYSTTDQINRGTIGSGAVGATTQQTTAFTTARHNFASVAYNGYIYVVGGYDGTSAYGDIQFSAINTSGSLTCPSGFTCSTGVFTTNATGFTTARASHTSVVYNGYLYIIGGWDHVSTFYNDIQRCQLNANGSAAACTQQTNAFTSGRDGHTSVAYNGYLYIIGGCTAGACSTYQNDIQYCPFNADGSVGTCTSQTTAFTTARAFHTSVAYNGYLYIIGGTNGTQQNDIQYCLLNTNGSVGTCTQQTSAFTNARESHTSVVYNGYLYIIGGVVVSTNQNDIQYCPVNANGSVGTCVQKTAAFTTARQSQTSVVYNGYLYILGGETPTQLNDIQYIPLGKGRAGSSTQQAAAFTTARNGHTSVVYNGFLYIIGGCSSGSCGSYLNDISHCPINADGSIGTCVQQTGIFTTARAFHSSEAYNGYLYIVGGNNGVAQQSDLQRCVLNNTTGAVGTCTQQTTAFTGTRESHGSILYNGYLYIVGGDFNTVNQNDIQYTWLDPATGAGCLPSNHATCTGTVFAQQTNAFTTARQALKTTVYNGYLYITGGENPTQQNDIQYCPLNTNGSVGACVQQTNAFTTGRHNHSAVAINGYLYIMGGDNGSGSVLNDLQYCPINSTSHAVGTCVQLSSAFTTARKSHTSVAYNGYIYVIGGWDGTTFFSDIQRMLIGPSNSGAGTATQQTAAFTTTRAYHVSVAYNGYLYITGGTNGTTQQGDIQYTWINPATGAACLPSNHATCTGTVFAQQTSAFTNTRQSHTSVVYNGYIYIVGGDSNLTNQNDIMYAWLDPATGAACLPSNHATCTGTVFARQTSAFTGARQAHSSVVYNGFLYIIGGSASGTNQNDIQYTWLDSSTGAACLPSNHATCSGTVFTQQTSAFTTARSSQSSVAYNGYLYIIGGLATGSVYQSDIQYCPINTNGSIGTCVQQLSAFNTARYDFTAVVYNGYLHIIGGIASGSAYQNDIQYCPIDVSGSVGSCVQQTSAFTTARTGHASVVYNGYLYVVGGLATASAYQNDVQRLASKSMTDSARYERTIDTGASGNTLNSFVINGVAKCSYTVAYKTAGSSFVYGSATTIYNVYPGISQTITVATQRYIQFVATLDDSACGGQSNITDISLTYNSIPSAPTLVLPASGAIGTSVLPEFRMGSADDSSDYLQYKIEVCTTSNCSSVLRTIDQTLSQTGWLAQSLSSSTAYTSGLAVTQLGVHTYQPTALTASTQYWWRAYAIDPGGTNLWSPASGINTFTTGVALPTQINIGGGTSIYSGTTIGG